ncbi:MAG: glycosyltransferase [Alphaproteobacteria bacterium]|nr:glycosyltransferase [Alphaproteobacteria bacterium]
MAKNDIRISVIVPVYNVAPYLARCLDSLVAQTLSDIEIICIDDKSTDNSLEILHEYENKYPQIHVIALDKNSGVATARNAGIDAARGEYLGFVDSDDYVDTDFYEKLYATAKKENADMARGNVKIVQYDGTIIKDHNEIKNVEKYGKWHFSWQWWCAIYRTRMINENTIRFLTNITNGEDTVFLTTCVSCSNSLVSCPGVFYNYIRREGSLDEPMMPPHKIGSILKSCHLLADIYNSSEEISERDYIARYVWVIGSIQDKIYRNTSKAVRREIAAAAIDIFQKCKKKAGVIKILKNTVGKHFSDCLQSCDIEGIMEHWGKLIKTTQHTKRDIKKEYYLFGVMPIAKFIHTEHKLIVRVCGLQLLRAKNEYGIYRLYFLYIPIIKVKTK